jgi:hypothetical protein
MRQLEEDGTPPTSDHDHLAVDSPTDAFRPGPHVVGSEEARAYSGTVALE